MKKRDCDLSVEVREDGTIWIIDSGTTWDGPFKTPIDAIASVDSVLRGYLRDAKQSLIESYVPDIWDTMRGLIEHYDDLYHVRDELVVMSDEVMV